MHVDQVDIGADEYVAATVAGERVELHFSSTQIPLTVQQLDEVIAMLTRAAARLN